MKECEFCGINLEAEEEMFGGYSPEPNSGWTGHSCRGSEESDQQMILRALGALRYNGVPCFLSTGIISQELANQIKGRG